MNEKILKHVQEYNTSKGYGITEEDVIETILDHDPILWKDSGDKHRWWTVYRNVTKINGMLIGYEDAETTGDETARDNGYVFDPNSICEMEEKEITVKTYIPKS